MKSYEEMLNEAFEKMPEKIKENKRFEIPKLISFIEGNKTIVKNFKHAIEKIRRDPEKVTKFFSRELATPVSLEGERMILQRRINNEFLNKKFLEYVNKFVKCKECGGYDTHIENREGVKVLVCEICGARYSVR